VTTYVLDASVAIALVIDEAGSADARRIAADGVFLVPSAFWTEVANALVRKVRLGAADREGALAAYGLLRRIVTRTVPTARLGPVAMELAFDLPHPAYDCFYLAAAIAHGALLLTADRALHDAATASGYGPAIRLIG